jgi:TetR/AcrR family transcriptional repressor of mexJK operon
MRERILAAAFEVFIAHGYTGATTDLIQATAGVSKATIYAHFSGKEELFREMMELQFSRGVVDARAVSATTETLESFLRAVGLILLTAVLSAEGISVTRLMIAESQRFPNLGKLFYLLGPKPLTEFIEMRISEGRRGGEVEVDDPAMAAEQFVGMIKGDYHLRGLLGYPIPPDEELERYVDQVVAVFLGAHRPSGMATPKPDRSAGARRSYRAG